MAIAELWLTFKEAIFAYTGLSPVAFFTAITVAVALYYVISGFFQQPPPPRAMNFEPLETPPPPVQLGEVTEEDLRQYDGSDPKKPLLMAIKGQIYDVSQSRIFYGPGGPYALFAGKDASRALAKMSFETQDLTGDISGLGPFELDALQDWEYRFMGKYVKVGTVKKPVPLEDDGSSANDGPTEPAVEEPSVTVLESKEANGFADGGAELSEASPTKEREVSGENKELPPAKEGEASKD